MTGRVKFANSRKFRPLQRSPGSTATGVAVRRHHPEKRPPTSRQPGNRASVGKMVDATDYGSVRHVVSTSRSAMHVVSAAGSVLAVPAALSRHYSARRNFAHPEGSTADSLHLVVLFKDIAHSLYVYFRAGCATCPHPPDLQVTS
jgi:hypothetical protein